MRHRHARYRPPFVLAASASVLVTASLFAALAALPVASPAAAQAAPGAGPAPELIVLVRHAETQADGTRDPALSAAGLMRAERLAVLFRDAGLTAVHSTAYRRTRATAEPVAASFGGEVAEYDPRDLPGVAARLRTQPGRHVVVGHSNTTPELVRLLGGDPGPPIPEDEYGRIYVLFQAAEGFSTVVLRY